MCVESILDLVTILEYQWRHIGHTALLTEPLVALLIVFLCLFIRLVDSEEVIATEVFEVHLIALQERQIAQLVVSVCRPDMLAGV
jgi:hypothetical protein